MQDIKQVYWNRKAKTVENDETPMACKELYMI